MTKTVQVCRDDDGDYYVICPLVSVRPKKVHGEWEQVDRKGNDRSMLYGRSEIKVLLPGIKLKPGDGPVRVTITVERDD